MERKKAKKRAINSIFGALKDRAKQFTRKEREEILGDEHRFK